MTKESVNVLVDGGSASAGPPLGPALGPLGIKIADVVNEINKKTAEFAGMKIPVDVVIDTETKTFEIKVGSPPTSALIKKELGMEKGSSDGKPVGDLKFQQVMKIADMKKGSLLAKDQKASIKEVVGTCQSVNVTIEGRSPKEIVMEINEGLLDDVMAGKTTEMPEIVIEEEEAKIVGMEEEPVEVAEAEVEGEGTEEKKVEGEIDKKEEVKEKKDRDKPK